MEDVARIISQLEQQRTAIDRAISALREVAGSTTVQPVKKNSAPKKKASKKAPARPRKRHLSPEGRARIIEATKKRWADKRAVDANQGSAGSSSAPSKKRGKRKRAAKKAPAKTAESAA